MHNLKPLVLGGNCNSTLVAWLTELGVDDFLHAALNIRSIAPDDIKLSAEYIRSTYGHASYFITVGQFADKALKEARIDHGALPSTTTKDKKVIQHSLMTCRNYLLRSCYYAPTTIIPS